MTIEVQIIDGQIFNKNGFPLDECSRCAATGHYSFNTVTGSRCFKCNGSGFTIQDRALPAWKALQDEIATHKRCTPRIMKVGDVVAHNRIWKTIVSIETTDQVCGWFQRGDSEKVYEYKMILKFADGTEDCVSQNEIMKRAYKIDIAKYREMIPSASSEEVK